MRLIDNYKTKVIYDEHDKDYIATIPDIIEFEFLSAFGETPEKALEELDIALNLLTEDWEYIPKPNNIQSVEV
jgi:predicted RNase H-like HicB family nuclease